jgi:hypothetical protein
MICPGQTALPPQVVKFKGAAGRAIFNAVFSRNRVDSSQLFLQGRTAFVFDLESANSSDVPTTLRRSKADCPEVHPPLPPSEQWHSSLSQDFFPYTD